MKIEGVINTYIYFFQFWPFYKKSQDNELTFFK